MTNLFIFKAFYKALMSSNQGFGEKQLHRDSFHVSLDMLNAELKAGNLDKANRDSVCNRNFYKLGQI